MAKAKRYYWDSGAWIDLLNGKPQTKRALEIIYNAAKRGEVEIWTSTISHVEVFMLESEKGTHKPYPSANEDVIAQLLEQPFIKLIPVDLEIARHARKILRETPGFKNKPDAIHLASALRWSVDALHTFDTSDLISRNGQFTKKDGTPLLICVPDETTDGPLFANQKTGNA
ncbi:putative nucleic acid-binding protein [Mesorhizobium sp. USDA 4775]